MSNVIEFQSAAQLRKLLAEREAENAELKAQVQNLSSVKEMLTLQTLDLNEQVSNLIEQMTIIQRNLDSLLKRLDNNPTK